MHVIFNKIFEDKTKAIYEYEVGVIIPNLSDKNIRSCKTEDKKGRFTFDKINKNLEIDLVNTSLFILSSINAKRLFKIALAKMFACLENNEFENSLSFASCS